MPSNPIGYICKREYTDTTFLSRKILSERLKASKSLYSKNLLAHYGCVNAIEFSSGGELLASGGDDRRVLLWNVEEALQGIGQPQSMRAQHISNIFCLGYDSKNTKIFSAGNDDQVIVHDTQTGEPIDYFLHEQPVYSLSIDPCNDNVFASACDDGRILIYDIRQPSSSDPFVLASYSSPFHGVMFNPTEARIVATANAKEGAGLWDVRMPQKVLLEYGVPESCMSVRWDSRGLRLLALRRRLPPVLYAIHSSYHLAQFDHPSYYNSCTMKSCCFAGDEDQYILSGSDDFNLYMWKIPNSESGAWVSSAHMILSGHRSIVNQVRFNPSNHLIASSGVEKLIKVWSPFPLPHLGEADPSAGINQRRVFSHEEYISLVLRSGQFISHDYSHQSTKEDPRMMAFFDSLVQREIEGWSSDVSHSEPSPIGSDQSLSDSPLSSGSEHGDDNNLGSPKSKSPPVNPIVQLIARKRAQLVRLAQNSHLGIKRKHKRKKSRDSNSGSDSADSGTASSSRRRYSRKRAHSSSHSSSTSSDDDNEEEEEQRHLSQLCKKRKPVIHWDEVDGSSENGEVVSDHETVTSSSNNNNNNNIVKEPSTSSETPDSGIAISEQPTSSRIKSRSHRNYRKRIQDSDSE